MIPRQLKKSLNGPRAPDRISWSQLPSQRGQTGRGGRGRKKEGGWRGRKREELKGSVNDAASQRITSFLFSTGGGVGGRVGGSCYLILNAHAVSWKGLISGPNTHSSNHRSKSDSPFVAHVI